MLTPNKVLGDLYYRCTLSNGLDVIIYPKEHYNGVLISASANFGGAHTKFEYTNSIGERVSRTIPIGTAHFIEHILFSYGNNLSYYDLFNKMNIPIEGDTDVERTNFSIHLSNDDYDNFEDILFTFLKMIFIPKFTEHTVNIEKSIINQEINETCSKADMQQLIVSLSEVYSQDEPIALISGSHESISHITKELLLECHKIFYHPSNVCMVIIGNIDPDIFIEYLNVFFSKNDFGDPIPFFIPIAKSDFNGKEDRYITTALEKHKNIFDGIYKKDLNVDVSIVLKLTPNWSSITRKTNQKLSDNITLDLFYTLFFTQPHNSKVINELHEENVIVSPAVSFIISSYNFACFYIFFECADFSKQHAQKILKEIRNFPGRKISKESFEIARKKIYARILSRFDSSNKLKEQIIEHYHYSGDNIKEYIDYLINITPEEFSKNLSNIFSSHYFTIVALE